MNQEITLATKKSKTMSLKEITDLLDVRHNNAMKIVEKMVLEPEFGNATKIQYRTDRNNEYETYQLDYRQSIAVGARLSTPMLMKLVDRWEQLEAGEAATQNQLLLEQDIRKHKLEGIEEYKAAIEAKAKYQAFQEAMAKERFSTVLEFMANRSKHQPEWWHKLHSMTKETAWMIEAELLEGAIEAGEAICLNGVYIIPDMDYPLDPRENEIRFLSRRIGRYANGTYRGNEKEDY